MSQAIDWSLESNRRIGTQFLKDAAAGRLTTKRMLEYGNGTLLAGLPWSELAKGVDTAGAPDCIDARFQGCTFEAIEGGYLRFQSTVMHRCEWNRCALVMLLRNVDLSQCAFRQCVFRSSSFNIGETADPSVSFTSCVFDKCDLRDASFSGCFLKDVVFEKCNMRRVWVTGSSFRGVVVIGKFASVLVRDIGSAELIKRGGVFEPHRAIESRPVLDLSRAQCSDVDVKGNINLSDVIMPEDGHAHSYRTWMSKARAAVVERSQSMPDAHADWNLVVEMYFDKRNHGEWYILTEKDVYKLHPRIANEFLEVIKPFIYR